MLWKLMFIGSKASCTPFLGKNEQRDKDLIDSGIPFIDSIPFNVDSKENLARIEQIDCIWTLGGKAMYAFEVEGTTSILSGFERFSALIEEVTSVARNRSLVIVIPKKRLKKLLTVMTTSTYVGKPLYFENKVRVLFYEDVDGLFEKCKDSYFKIGLLEKSLKTIDHLIRK